VKNSSVLKNRTAVILLFIAALLYRTEWLENYFSWSSSTTQFILVPAVLVAALLFSFWQEVVPRYAIAVAFLASACLGFASFGQKADGKEDITIYLAPFVADTNQAQTIKFSDLIVKNLADVELGLRPVPLSNPLSSAKAVQEFFQRELDSGNKSASIVISGNPRWLTMSVNSELSKSLVSRELGKILSPLNLNVVTDLSGTGLSDGLSLSSRDYLVRVIAAYSDLSRLDFGSAERNISDAAGVVGRWSTTSHRAYALWVLGTISLNRAFSEETLEPAYLDCAITYFTRARRFIRRGESPELLAAILNNRGVAHFLSYMFEMKKPLRRQALREFRSASKIASKKATITSTPSWLVARLNWRSFNQPKDLKRQFAKKVGKGRGKGKKQMAQPGASEKKR